MFYWNIVFDILFIYFFLLRVEVFFDFIFREKKNVYIILKFLYYVFLLFKFFKYKKVEFCLKNK